MSTSNNSAFTDNIFANLVTYLNAIKPQLYRIVDEDTTNDDTHTVLLQHRSVLEEIKDKLESYKADVSSTIKHIDDILESSEIDGGKIRKKKSHKRKNKKQITKKRK